MTQTYDLSSQATNVESFELDMQRQLELEQEALASGITAYRNRTLKAEQGGYAATTDYGKRLVSAKVDVLAEAVRKFIADAKIKPGPRASAVTLMEKLEADVVSFIALRATIDIIGIRGEMHMTAMNIANEIEDECRFRAFSESKKQLFEKVNENFDNSPWAYSNSRRRSVLAHADNKFNNWSHWPHEDRLRLGTALLGLIVESTGLIVIERENKRRYKNQYLVKPSPDFLQWVEGFNAHQELMSPRHMPMVIPPRPWADPYSGGYYDERLCYRLRLVKKATGGYLKELAHKEMPDVYASVNALQETAWKINSPVLTIIREIWEAGLEVKGFPSRNDIPLPIKPDDMDTNPVARTLWKKKASESYKANVRAGSKRIQTAKILFLADKFAPEPSIYFPIQLDFRGRMYAVPLFLNPQGCDLAKSLLTFAQGKPLGKDGVRWLAIHLANTFGEDKCSLDARAAWAHANSARIESVANDPLSDKWWMEADKPFQFLAACVEWLGYLHDGGEGYVCSLPIMVDGSCNGLQHFSAMLRDEVCGAQVNLVPADKPADVYQAVADAVVDKLGLHATGWDESKDPSGGEFARLWLAYGIDRKLCKRPVMVLPYGGTRQAVLTYIQDEVDDRASEKNIPHPFGDQLNPAVQYLASVMWETMKEVVKGPRVAMDWLRDVARLLSKNGRRIYWTTPTGFWVRQAYPNTKDRAVNTKVGHRTIKFKVRDDLPNSLDRRKQAQAVAPNFVHSLDAAALALTVLLAGQRGVTHFTAIHDSYGTLAADMQTLSNTLRETFVSMYEAHDVLTEFRQAAQDALTADGEEAPPAPPRGTLDLGGVLASEFFFA